MGHFFNRAGEVVATVAQEGIVRYFPGSDPPARAIGSGRSRLPEQVSHPVLEVAGAQIGFTGSLPASLRQSKNCGTSAPLNTHMTQAMLTTMASTPRDDAGCGHAAVVGLSPLDPAASDQTEDDRDDAEQHAEPTEHEPNRPRMPVISAAMPSPFRMTVGAGVVVAVGHRRRRVAATVLSGWRPGRVGVGVGRHPRRWHRPGRGEGIAGGTPDAQSYLPPHLLGRLSRVPAVWAVTTKKGADRGARRHRDPRPDEWTNGLPRASLTTVRTFWPSLRMLKAAMTSNTPMMISQIPTTSTSVASEEKGRPAR